MALVLDPGGDAGNAGAQTGSVTHSGIEGFHRSGGDQQEGLRALLSSLPLFPQADEAKARGYYEKYVADPENQTAQVTHLEQKVALNYRGELYIAGTLDQVRVDKDGVSRVWDVKTGSYYTPEMMLTKYALQQAAYVLAARETFGLEIHPGGIIRMAGYESRRGRVFLPMRERTVDDCDRLLEPLLDIVRDLRAGNSRFVPSKDNCRFCPARNTCEKRVT